MAEKDGFYFDNLTLAAGYCVEAAKYLNTCFENFDSGKIEEMLEKMHEIEHKGDEKRHEMSSALAKAFVTPVDREDLAAISQCVDDVNDRLEEVLQRLYTDCVKEITPDAAEFSAMILGCCEKMKNVISEFVNFKKSRSIHSMIVELNTAEEECDSFYLECSKNVTEKLKNPLDIFTWRAIYDMLEQCADECEKVGDCVDTVIMKNH